MKAGRHSRTADAAAAARARHYLRDPKPLIFEDPFALQLTSSGWRQILGSRVLSWLVFDLVLRPLRPAQAQVLARSRYAEDALAEALSEGIRQYVIVSAGFDSFALRRRDLRSILHIIEIDHPDTQREKRRRLGALEVELPADLEFLSADLSIERIDTALGRSRYDPRVPAFYSWLGTTAYLDNSSTLETLGSIAHCSTPGSRVVFDYALREDLLSGSEARSGRAGKRFVARMGEPIRGGFSPQELARAVETLGFELLEDLSAKEQHTRYFTGRADYLRPPEYTHFAQVRMRTAGSVH